MTTHKKAEKDLPKPVPKSNIELKTKVYKGVVMMENEIERIEVMPVLHDDVWVCSFPRSGTTLTQEMTYLIMTGDFDTAKTVQLDERFPIVEVYDERFPYYKGVQFIEDMKPPRLIKSHLHYFLLPEDIRRGKGRVIYVLRNPKDSIWSLYRVLRWSSHNKEATQSFEEFFEYFMKGENIVYGPWWTQVKQFWEHRDDENIMIIKYEEMVKDMPAAVRKIADFLSKVVSEDDVKKICEHCSLENMRKNDMVNLSYYREFKDVDDTNGGFINKGQPGVWREVLTEDMAKRVDEMIERELGGTGITFDES